MPSSPVRARVRPACRVATRADNAPIRCIDLFCGAGGSSRGAVAAGLEIVAAFDAWELAGRTYRDNFPRSRFFLGRIEDRSPDDLASQLGPVDLILASPECTSHSQAKGSRRRCNRSRETAFQVVRFARVLKPRWIVVENVASMRRWSRYRQFLGQLSDLGYHVREDVLNAADFGVPQSRHRLFLLCDRQRLPRPTSLPRRKVRAVREIVRWDAPFKWSPLRTKRRARATLKRAARAFAAIGRNRPFLVVYYGSDGAGGWQPLTRPLRTITTLDRFALVRPGEGGRHSMRMLQVPELQAAMGMDAMLFGHGTRRDRIRMIGNAVCPPVMQHVLNQLTRRAVRRDSVTDANRGSSPLPVG